MLSDLLDVKWTCAGNDRTEISRYGRGSDVDGGRGTAVGFSGDASFSSVARDTHRPRERPDLSSTRRSTRPEVPDVM